MKKQIKTIALVATGLVVGVVVERLKRDKQTKRSSVYVGDIKDYKSFLEKF